ncbi:MAG: alginate export family protein [Acidobacteriaceae bacterium]|nr:alginate export family protein [Acidobacteriaceae bacterium]
MYNLMNLKDGLLQAIDRPAKKWELRSDLHWLQLSSGRDVWYRGGGAYDNKVFGFTGRPGNGSASFTNLADLSSDWHATPHLDVNLYYGHGWGKTVVHKIYPAGQRAQLGYLELIYHWDAPFASRH